jgi:hypothetical protein
MTPNSATCEVNFRTCPSAVLLRSSIEYEDVAQACLALVGGAALIASKVCATLDGKK